MYGWEATRHAGHGRRSVGSSLNTCGRTCACVVREEEGGVPSEAKKRSLHLATADVRDYEREPRLPSRPINDLTLGGDVINTAGHVRLEARRG